jgi:6-phosphogluconolactonase
MNEMNKPNIRVFKDKFQLAEAAALDFEAAVLSASTDNRIFTVALSGGSTPALLFENLSVKTIDWTSVHLYWGDERCVSPDHGDSNYLMTRRTLLDKINIPVPNIHRIRGEDDPVGEASRYAGEILQTVLPGDEGNPRFDWIFLGLGEDGHTASVFPGDELHPGSICAVASHPETGQKRITLTLPVINNSRCVSFLVAGNSKARVVSAILNENADYLEFPAAHVNPDPGILEWFLDLEAAGELTIDD